MTVTIHPTLPAEAELLATIQKAAFKPLYDRYRDEGNPYLRGPEDILCRLNRKYRQYTIECDGETVGGILYRLHGKRRPYDPLTEGEYYLGRVYVHPLYQNKGIAAALFVILLCVLYTALFDKLGYVLVSAIVSMIIMWLIGKRKPLTVVLVSVLVPLVMWIVFYKLLSVNIPMGVLQPLRDLIDKI